MKLILLFLAALIFSSAHCSENSTTFDSSEDDSVSDTENTVNTDIIETDTIAPVELEEPTTFEPKPEAVVDRDYVIIIDGGSSHTDLYVYSWFTNKTNGTGEVVQVGKIVCQPVLSNFEKNVSAVGPTLEECFQFAHDNVPADKHNRTRVLLGATAGMRVLASRNKRAADSIFKAVRGHLRRYYKFIVRPKDAGILSPQKEGGFAWMAINYVKGIFKENAKHDAANRMPTWGSLDVGGASTQFSAEISNNGIKLRPSFITKVYGHTYKVYTKSFLCYGKNEAFRRYKARLIQSQNFANPVVDPCRPVGFSNVIEYDNHFERPCSNSSYRGGEHYKEKYEITGGGNGSACLEMVRDLFRMSMDLSRPSTCPFQDKECAFAGIGKGMVRGKFLGTGALYYDTRNLRILTNESYSLNPFDAAGFRHARDSYCAKSHDQVAELIESRPELRNFFIRTCFDATYVEVLLGDVYGLDDETLRDIIFAKNIDGVDVGWSLGWAIAVSTEEASSNENKKNGNKTT